MDDNKRTNNFPCATLVHNRRFSGKTSVFFICSVLLGKKFSYEIHQLRYLNKFLESENKKSHNFIHSRNFLHPIDDEPIALFLLNILVELQAPKNMECQSTN